MTYSEIKLPETLKNYKFQEKYAIGDFRVKLAQKSDFYLSNDFFLKKIQYKNLANF